MRWKLKLLTVLIGCVISAPAYSHMICVKANTLKPIEHLYRSFGEQVIARGVAAGGKTAIHVLLNEDTGTFTILRQLPDGRWCIVANGNSMAIEAVGSKV